MKWFFAIIFLFISFLLSGQGSTFIYSPVNPYYDEYPTAVAETQNGDLIISSEKGSITGGLYEILILKLRNTGELQKTVSISKPNLSLAVHDLLINENNEIIGIGTIMSPSESLAWIFCLDTSMNFIWEKSFDLAFMDIGPLGGFFSNNGNLVLHGTGGGISFYEKDIFILVLNQYYDSIFFKLYPEDGFQRLSSMIQKPDASGYYMINYGNFQIVTPTIGQLIQLDNDFHVTAVDSIPGDLSMYCNLLAIDEKLFISGSKDYPFSETEKLGIEKIDSDTLILYLGPDDTVSQPAYSTNLVQSRANLYYGGTIGIEHFFSRDITFLFLNKLDPDLDIKWQKRYGGDAHYYLWDIYATSDSGCLLLASRYGEENQEFERDIYILKVNSKGQITGINTSADSSPLKIYPNPASSYFYTDLRKEEKYVGISLFSSEGKEVKKLELDLASKIKITTEDLPRGLYLLKIKTDKGNYIRKVILMM